MEGATQQSYSCSLIGAHMLSKTNCTSPPSIWTSHAWQSVYLIFLVA